MSDTIDFTKEAIREYLDGCIRYWRDLRDAAESPEQAIQATCYVDAFQSVRTSLFGELLPSKENE
ncbi:MAG TPA: hypothetical protein ENI23_15555 [bacterium]|nr:hypothetical protein [bacterium]